MFIHPVHHFPSSLCLCHYPSLLPLLSSPIVLAFLFIAVTLYSPLPCCHHCHHLCLSSSSPLSSIIIIHHHCCLPFATVIFVCHIFLCPPSLPSFVISTVIVAFVDDCHLCLPSLPSAIVTVHHHHCPLLSPLSTITAALCWCCHHFYCLHLPLSPLSSIVAHLLPLSLPSFVAVLCLSFSPSSLPSSTVIVVAVHHSHHYCLCCLQSSSQPSAIVACCPSIIAIIVAVPHHCHCHCHLHVPSSPSINSIHNCCHCCHLPRCCNPLSGIVVIITIALFNCCHCCHICYCHCSHFNSIVFVILYCFCLPHYSIT